MDKFGLPDKAISEICNLLSSFNEIEEVKIFGSRARGNYKRGSDIDLAFIGNFGGMFINKIADELNELPTPYKFDVVDYKNINNMALKENIDNTGKLFYKKTI